jgi:hypothetical protein
MDYLRARVDALQNEVDRLSEKIKYLEGLLEVTSDALSSTYNVEKQ